MSIPALTIAPEFTVDVTETFDVEVSPFGSAIIQRGEWVEHVRRRFKLQWKRLRPSQLQTLRTLFAAVAGSAGRFTFTPTDEATEIDVRLVDDSFDYTIVNAAKVEASVTVEEF